MISFFFAFNLYNQIGHHDARYTDVSASPTTVVALDKNDVPDDANLCHPFRSEFPLHNDEARLPVAFLKQQHFL